MNELFKYNINEENLKEMLLLNPDIVDLSNKELEEKINILINLDCKTRHIRNILMSNPYYLTRLTSDVENLIKELLNRGFNNLNLLFDSNPHFLNNDSFEVKNYFEKELLLGKNIEDIIDEVSSNPFLI
jgi:hypothetical protein